MEHPASTLDLGHAADGETTERPEVAPASLGANGSRRFLTDILVGMGAVSRARIEEAVRDAQMLGSSPERLLVEQGAISSQQMAQALAERFGVEHLDLSQFEVDMAAANLIPVATAKRLSLVPVCYLDDGTLLVAMEDPSNVVAIDDLALRTGMAIKVGVAPGEDIALVISRMSRLDHAIADVVDDDPAEGPDVAELEAGAADTPVVKLVNSIIAQAVDRGASDIHFEPGATELRVRLRIDGLLVEATTVPPRMVAPLVSRIKIMADLDIAERRLPQDGRIALRFEGRQVDIRAVTLPSAYGESVVLRILDKDGVTIELEKLGMAGQDLERFKSGINRSYGAVLVTGPTGSGKSTTLYGAIGVINTPEKNIVTIEDPVEYQLDGVTQIPVNLRAGLGFATGLRSMMRADPDVIMVGEVRDRETAQIAVESALTGHLVLTTLHTNDAPSAVTRLAEMGIEPFLVASSVFCVVAQRLARVLCPSCREPLHVRAEHMQANGFDVGHDVEVFQPKGCSHCGGSGYRGRIGLYEVMQVSPRIRELILARASSDQIGQVAVEEGMRPLREDGLHKILNGTTSIDEVLRVSGGGS